MDSRQNLRASSLAGRGQFTLLVRHLLDRFFNNEIVSVEGETLSLVMTVAWAIALPTLVAAIFSFPGYHGFPPKPPRPPFWSQVADHYFYAMYSWVAMGAITVFEWDLLVPNALDVFVLSVLPIAQGRLLLGRVAAIVIFLGLFLLGTSSLGIVFFPLATEPPHIARAFAAHFAAVIMAGLCSASMLVALQGLLISVLGARRFRSFSTIVQSFLVMMLAIVLFLFPLLSRSLAALVGSDAIMVRCFPPFWFLGIYQSILAGPSGSPAFTRLAHIGYWATSLSIATAIATYPLAYQRSTRQAVEGFVQPHTQAWLRRSILHVLHATLVRAPLVRAIYHFIGQTLFRSQRHRLYLAIYAGVGIALACAWVVSFQIHADHLRIAVSTIGVRPAVPVLSFWTVAGLCTALLSPADPSGSWVFRLILGRESSDHLGATRLWVVMWALPVTLGAVAVLLALCGGIGMRASVAQATVAVGICVLLADIFLLSMRIIPFTEARVPRNTDLAFLLLRYIVFFPALVLVTAHYEPWVEASVVHVLTAVLFFAVAHAGLRLVQRWVVRERDARREAGEEGGMAQVLGLGS